MNDIQNVQPCNNPSLPRSGFFLVSKVCGTGNDNILDIVSLRIGIRFHSLENQRRNRDGVIFDAVKLVCGSIGLANVPLNEFNDSFGFDILLVLCNLAYDGVCPILEINSRSE